MSGADEIDMLLAEFQAAPFGRKRDLAIALAVRHTARSLVDLASMHVVRFAAHAAAAQAWAAVAIGVAEAVKRWPWLADVHRDGPIVVSNAGPSREFIRTIGEGLEDLSHSRRRRST